MTVEISEAMLQDILEWMRCDALCSCPADEYREPQQHGRCVRPRFHREPHLFVHNHGGCEREEA